MCCKRRSTRGTATIRERERENSDGGLRADTASSTRRWWLPYVAGYRYFILVDSPCVRGTATRPTISMVPSAKIGNYAECAWSEVVLYYVRHLQPGR